MSDPRPLSTFGITPPPEAPPEPPPALHVIVDAMPEISVTVPPLEFPATAATLAAQTTGNASLASLDGKAPALVSGRVPVDGSAVTQPVSAAALPLPTGAATSAAQTTGNASLASLDGKAPALVSGRVPVEVRPRTPETWIWTMPKCAVAASRLLWELFNNEAGKVVKVLGIFPIVATEVAVTGILGIELHANRVSTRSTLGTGNAWTTSGSWAQTTNGAAPADTANAAIPAGITGFFWPAGTAQGSAGNDIGNIASVYVMGEESATSMAYLFQGQTNMLGAFGGETQPITLRAGEGLKMLQGSVASVGSLRWRVVFTIE
jgi:hypothetical protein